MTGSMEVYFVQCLEIASSYLQILFTLLCAGPHATAYMWRSENNVGEFALSFYRVGWIQALCGKYLYPLSYLAVSWHLPPPPICLGKRILARPDDAGLWSQLHMRLRQQGYRFKACLCFKANWRPAWIASNWKLNKGLGSWLSSGVLAEYVGL